MKDLTLFGTETCPLRASALGSLVRCPWRAVMLYLDMENDSSGPAADTGSAAHHAVATWHQNGHDAEGAIAAMRAAVASFPLADLDEARLHVAGYFLDPRNRVELLGVEVPVRFTLDPAENDPTGAPIYVRGTLDQIRRAADGVEYVWDLKTSSLEGWQLIHEHAAQLAAYATGATQLLGRPVQPGGIIRTRGWRKRGVNPVDQPPGCFFHSTFTLDECPLLLDAVRSTVARIRAGDVAPQPGTWCSWCPAGGLDGCLPKLKSLL